MCVCLSMNFTFIFCVYIQLQKFVSSKFIFFEV